MRCMVEFSNNYPVQITKRSTNSCTGVASSALLVLSDASRMARCRCFVRKAAREVGAELGVQQRHAFRAAAAVATGYSTTISSSGSGAVLEASR